MINPVDATPPPTPTFRLLSQSEWLEAKGAHEAAVDELTAAHLSRRSRGERHPVWDFMFDYYPVTPGKLRRWHPGVGVALEVAEAGAAAEPELPQVKGLYGWAPAPATDAEGAEGAEGADKAGVAGDAAVGDTAAGAVWALNVPAFLEARGTTVFYIERFLRATASRPPQLGCFGLHEWAMVYKDTPRHPEPLRLGAEGTDAVVEASNLRCTHFDAYRFFSPASAPRNNLAPTRATQPALEQPGCLHATMDLYKWATKLGPLVPGDLWLDTFRLACDVRQLDMEASPYDLLDWGFEPVRIETPAGRAEYVRRQRTLAERGQELRQRLLELIGRARSIAGTPAGDLN